MAINLILNFKIGTTVLHNFLRTEKLNLLAEQMTYCPPGYVDNHDEKNGAWRLEGNARGMRDITMMGSNNYAKNAKEMRDRIAEYFVSTGALPWQNERASILHEWGDE